MKTISRLQNFAILLCLLLSTAYSSTAFATLTWETPPDNLQTSPNVISIDFSASPSGNAFTAWTTLNQVFVSRFSDLTGAYGPVENIYNAFAYIFDVKVVTDASETALLIWYDRTLYQLLTALYDGTYVTPVP